MSYSVAFKCTYNDGGENVYVGFADTCSRDNIVRNVIDEKRVWCSNKECRCAVFCEEGLRGNKPTPPGLCMESELFRKWQFGAGHFHHGTKRGEPIPITKAKTGGFAILTTRLPGEPEKDRRIIGLFRIARIDHINMVIAGPRGRIRLPLEEAKALYFWAYCSNKVRKPVWGAGLFRYLEDGQVHRILTDVASTVRDEDTKSEIHWLITQAFGSKLAPRARGCLPGKSADRSTAIAKARKYGPGGEGKAHRELKEWIAKHPKALKLTDVVSVSVEHPFKSGDLADVVFRHKSGHHTVVEIETTTPLPGAHQAIKYRALLCAQNGLPLDSERVQAFLVAWSIPGDVQDFCRKYGVQLHAHRLT